MQILFVFKNKRTTLTEELYYLKDILEIRKQTKLNSDFISYDFFFSPASDFIRSSNIFYALLPGCRLAAINIDEKKTESKQKKIFFLEKK